MGKLNLLILFSVQIIWTKSQPAVYTEHCCQNDLCPIDCVRCDGKPTCYDLSDELGCNNATDQKLLSYERPAIFVPFLLNVIKAQIRKEKIDRAFQYKDRNCFYQPEPQTLPPYLKPSTKVATLATTTETPLWQKLLNALKERVEPTTTTTTTEVPIWKLLLNKLQAEQRGEVFITSFAPGWSQESTQPTVQASITPPWKLTVIPPLPSTTATAAGSSSLKHNERPITLSRVTQDPKIELQQQKVEEKVFFVTPQPDPTTVQPEKSTLYFSGLSNVAVSTLADTLSDISTEIARRTVTQSAENNGINPTANYEQVSNTSQINVTHEESSEPRLLSTEIPTTAVQVTHITPATDITMKSSGITNSAISKYTLDRTDTVEVNVTANRNITNFNGPKIEQNDTDLQSALFFSAKDSVSIESTTISKTEIPAVTLSVNESSENIVNINNTQQDESNNSTLYYSSEENRTMSTAGMQNTSAITDSVPETDVVTANTDIHTKFQADNKVTLVNEKVDASTEKNKDAAEINPAVVVLELETPSPLEEKTMNISLNGVSFDQNITHLLLNMSDANENNTVDVLPVFQYQSRNNSDNASFDDPPALSRLKIYRDNANFFKRLFTDEKASSDIAEVNVLIEKLIGGKENYTYDLKNLKSSNSTVRFDKPFNDTSSDLSIQDVNITGLEFYAEERNVTNNSTKDIAVHVQPEDNQKTSASVNVYTNSLLGAENEMSPGKEVRVLLGKLSALVSNMSSSQVESNPPYLREFSHSTNASMESVTTVYPTNTARSNTELLPVLMPTVKPSPAPRQVQILNSPTTEPPLSPTATPLPWWQQPLTFDGLFGFGTQPPAAQNWFPTTTAFSWDAFFGLSDGFQQNNQAAQRPLTTQSPFDLPLIGLNPIYDPLEIVTRPQGQVTTPLTPSELPPTTQPSFAEATTPHSVSAYNETLNTGLETLNFSDTQGILRFPLPSSPNANISSGFDAVTTPPARHSVNISSGFDAVTTPPTSHSVNVSSGFGIVTPPPTFTDSARSISKSEFFVSTDSFIDKILPTNSTQISPVTNTEAVTTTDKMLTPKTVVTERHSIGDIKSSIPSSNPTTPPTTFRTPMSHSHDIVSTTKKLGTTTAALGNWWDNPFNIPTLGPVRPGSITGSVPVARQVAPITQSPTTQSSWNIDPGRFLSTDLISLWWDRVQPTTVPPAVTPQPTTTPAGEIECHEIQDPTGFCTFREGHYRNQRDCRSYYVCNWGFLYQCTCPPNTLFDETLSVCNWAHNVTCAQ